MLLSAVERVLLTVWVGSLWGVGYLAAPVLFAQLDDPAAAAGLSEALKGAVAWVSIGCAAVLIPAQLRHRVRPLAAHWRLWLLVALVLLVGIGELGVRPPMAEVVAQAGQGGNGVAALRTAESLYLVASAIGLALVLGGLQPRE
ncbi:DUF4149 domain-containing protein [Halorhodospira neutriphila]|uniref:DUF4149 domain-containing protein n=1 Tax=Halorhodospira neutriphila TaxID=168379 RepID=UPI001905F4F4|nr:DUF4149 domain-containing protein [Halorhodospira neutriphila]